MSLSGIGPGCIKVDDLRSRRGYWEGGPGGRRPGPLEDRDERKGREDL
jgi:hypothetical protein